MFRNKAPLILLIAVISGVVLYGIGQRDVMHPLFGIFSGSNAPHDAAMKASQPAE